MQEYFKEKEPKENNQPYAYYLLGIHWIPHNIINDGEKNGYIVQKVKFLNTTGIKINQDNKDDFEYYEAWKVENEKVVNMGQAEFDDAFLYGNKNVIGDCIRNSLGKIGIIKYSSQVYWISEKNKIYNIIDKWKENKVKMSGGLKSEYVNECHELEKCKPIFNREDFIHEVNFCNKEIIKKAIQETFKVRIMNKDKNFPEDLYEILKDTEYIDIFDEIL